MDLFSIPTNVWLGVAVIIATLFGEQAVALVKTVLGGGAKLFTGLNWFSGKSTATTSEVDDIADLQALKRVQARFDRLKCKEAQTAVTVCFVHFFHSEGHT
jgi:hypothetical protein